MWNLDKEFMRDVNLIQTGKQWIFKKLREMDFNEYFRKF